MSAVACGTCHRIIDDEADVCPGCGKKYGTFRIKIVCTSLLCEGQGGWYNDGECTCRECNGAGKFLSTDSNLKTCPECGGNGYPFRQSGWLFKNLVRQKCKTCSGRGVLR